MGDTPATGHTQDSDYEVGKHFDLAMLGACTPGQDLPGLHALQ